jgi:hypothetical protein
MKLKLIYYDDEAERQEVEVTTSRFAIGRHDDNDFIIDDSNLSRRHALIENYDGGYFLSDCASQNGTTLNGKPVSGLAQINNGDVIKLGDSFEMRVEFVKEATQQESKPVASAKSSSSVATKKTASTNQKVSSTTSGLSVQTIQVLIGVIAVSVVLVIGTLVIVVVSSNRGKNGNENINQNINESINENTNIGEETPSPGPSPTAGVTPNNTNNPNTNNTNNPPNVPIEDAAKKAVKQMSSDDIPYAFSPKILTAINARAESFRNSSQLRDALKRLSGSSIAAQAKNEGLPPALVIYTALALTEGGRNDSSAKAAAILSDFAWLYRTFGTGTADSSLIVVAAFTYGTGNKKNHPIHDELRKIPSGMKNRNVWYMHENNLLKDEAYNLVLNTIALGAIAQNPKQFGIDAPPLTF